MNWWMVGLIFSLCVNLLLGFVLAATEADLQEAQKALGNLYRQGDDL